MDVAVNCILIKGPSSPWHEGYTHVQWKQAVCLQVLEWNMLQVFDSLGDLKPEGVFDSERARPHVRHHALQC